MQPNEIFYIFVRQWKILAFRRKTWACQVTSGRNDASADELLDQRTSCLPLKQMKSKQK